MTTYDFIVFEQKKQRARSAANSTAPAAESKADEIAEERDTIQGDGDGSRDGDGDELGGGGKGGVDDATETMTESERVVVDEVNELQIQMQRKKHAQEQQRTVRGQPIPFQNNTTPDPILELYNQQQRSLPQGRLTSAPSLPPLHPFGMGNDFIPSRVHNSESPKTGSSRGSSVISTGSAIEFYADQFAASDDYTVIEPLSELSLSTTKVANTGAHLTWNAGPKSVSQLQIGSPKNKVSVFGRKGSLVSQYRGDGENKSTGSESETDKDKDDNNNKPLPLEYPESLIPNGNGNGQGSRVPPYKSNGTGTGVGTGTGTGVKSVGGALKGVQIPVNPFTPIKSSTTSTTSPASSGHENGSNKSNGYLNGSHGVSNSPSHNSNGHHNGSTGMDSSMKSKVIKALLQENQQEEEKDALKNLPAL